tara:strand:- start:198 stop:647 length:450 start_codon:yes stop_codon:yes gene_type:complete
MSKTTSGKFFAIKTTIGQENVVIQIARLRINADKLKIKGLLAHPGLKGTIIVEAPNAGIVNTVLGGMRHVRKVVFGTVDLEEIKNLIKVEDSIIEYQVGDTVDVISGPFRDMKGRIVRVEIDKKEAVIEFLDVNFTLPVTITTDMIKKA